MNEAPWHTHAQPNIVYTYAHTHMHITARTHTSMLALDIMCIWGGPFIPAGWRKKQLCRGRTVHPCGLSTHVQTTCTRANAHMQMVQYKSCYATNSDMLSMPAHVQTTCTRANTRMQMVQYKSCYATNRDMPSMPRLRWLRHRLPPLRLRLMG